MPACPICKAELHGKGLESALSLSETPGFWGCPSGVDARAAAVAKCAMEAWGFPVRA